MYLFSTLAISSLGIFAICHYCFNTKKSNSISTQTYDFPLKVLEVGTQTEPEYEYNVWNNYEGEWVDLIT